MRFFHYILFLTLLPLASFAQDELETSGTCGPGLNWALEGTVIRISGSGPMNNFTTRYISDEDEDSEENAALTEKQKAKIRKQKLKERAKMKKKVGYVEDNMDHLIPWYNFNKFVTGVIVEEGVTTIGDNAFKGFKELTTVQLPSSLEMVGRESFYWCIKLDSIKLTNANIISIGAFSGCYALKSVDLGRNITTIEKSAFYQCKGLRKVNYGGSLDDWFVIDFQSENSNPIKYAGRLYIDNQLVTEVHIPDTMTIVPPYVCMGMTSLKKLYIPEGVVSIGPHCFDGCRALSIVDSRPVEPPFLERYAFLNTDIRKVYIYSNDYKDSYQTAWGKRYSYLVDDPLEQPQEQLQPQPQAQPTEEQRPEQPAEVKGNVKRIF